MALTAIQRRVCRLLAARRIAAGESYLAGGLALNELLGASRLSRDVDLFHDTESAVAAAFAADQESLEAAGFEVRRLREVRGFVEAEVASGGERLRVEWSRDSSFRFFPLVEHAELGLVLHPFDLATNKVLALVGRLEPRDWVDVVACHERLQPFGYLAWAACGKDPGFGPSLLVEHAAKNGRYSAVELEPLAFAGERPDAADLSRRWHALIAEAREIVDRLPAEQVGQAVLDAEGRLCRLSPGAIAGALARGELRFHPGRIGGALPVVHPS